MKQGASSLGVLCGSERRPASICAWRLRESSLIRMMPTSIHKSLDSGDASALVMMGARLSGSGRLTDRCFRDALRELFNLGVGLELATARW